MLCLSTDAAPRLPIDALVEACRARGVEGQELVIEPDDDADAVLARARAASANIVALRVRELDEASVPQIARCSAALAAPVTTPSGAVRADRVPALARAFTAAGGRLLLGHGGVLDDALGIVASLGAAGSPPSVGTAWEIEPWRLDPSETSAVLLVTRDFLGAVRLHGGGPEQRDHDGRGVGPLFTELALSGFRGPIILTPSAPALVPRWTAWLDARGASGCGHASSSRSIDLDVRDVEPRHRLETILGAYGMLVPGMKLELTVDHDPICMYYTLQANEDENTFSFQVVEHGPEVWRATVTKR